MQIEDEIEKGILPDPAALDPITGEPLPIEGSPEDPNMQAEEQAQAEEAAIMNDMQKADKTYQKDIKSGQL